MTRRISQILILAALAAFFAFSSCRKDSSNPYGGSSSNPPGPNTVTMVNIAFSPSSLTVTRGTTVTWKNNDGVAHTSTSDTGVWETGNIASGGSKTTTFNTAGTYKYHCTIHGFSMSGTIIVQ